MKIFKVQWLCRANRGGQTPGLPGRWDGGEAGIKKVSSESSPRFQVAFVQGSHSPRCAFQEEGGLTRRGGVLSSLRLAWGPQYHLDQGAPCSR